MIPWLPSLTCNIRRLLTTYSSTILCETHLGMLSKAGTWQPTWNTFKQWLQQGSSPPLPQTTHSTSSCSSPFSLTLHSGDALRSGILPGDFSLGEGVGLRAWWERLLVTSVLSLKTNSISVTDAGETEFGGVKVLSRVCACGSETVTIWCARRTSCQMQRGGGRFLSGNKVFKQYNLDQFTRGGGKKD